MTTFLLILIASTLQPVVYILTYQQMAFFILYTGMRMFTLMSTRFSISRPSSAYSSKGTLTFSSYSVSLD